MIITYYTMGFREKVALLITTIILIEIACTLCMPRTIKKSALKQFLKSSKKNKQRATSIYQKPALKSNLEYQYDFQNIDEQKKAINRIFNFPEMEYPKIFRTLNKYEPDIVIDSKQNNVTKYLNNLRKETKLKRKCDAIINSNNANKSDNKTASSGAFILKDIGTFPEIQYPQSANEIWMRNFWNYVPYVEQSQLTDAAPKRILGKATMANSKTIKDIVQKYTDWYKSQGKITSPCDLKKPAESVIEKCNNNATENLVTSFASPSICESKNNMMPLPYQMTYDSNDVNGPQILNDMSLETMTISTEPQPTLVDTPDGLSITPDCILPNHLLTVVTTSEYPQINTLPLIEDTAPPNLPKDSTPLSNSSTTSTNTLERPEQTEPIAALVTSLLNGTPTTVAITLDSLLSNDPTSAVVAILEPLLQTKFPSASIEPLTTSDPPTTFTNEFPANVGSLSEQLLSIEPQTPMTTTSTPSSTSSSSTIMTTNLGLPTLTPTTSDPILTKTIFTNEPETVELDTTKPVTTRRPVTTDRTTPMPYLPIEQTPIATTSRYPTTSLPSNTLIMPDNILDVTSPTENQSTIATYSETFLDNKSSTEFMTGSSDPTFSCEPDTVTTERTTPWSSVTNKREVIVTSTIELPISSRPPATVPTTSEYSMTTPYSSMYTTPKPTLVTEPEDQIKNQGSQFTITSTNEPMISKEPVQFVPTTPKPSMTSGLTSTDTPIISSTLQIESQSPTTTCKSDLGGEFPPTFSLASNSLSSPANKPLMAVTPKPSLPCEYDSAGPTTTIPSLNDEPKTAADIALIPSISSSTTTLEPITPQSHLIDDPQVTAVTTCEPLMESEIITSKSTTSRPSSIDTTTATLFLPTEPQPPETTTPLPNTSSESLTLPPPNTPDLVSQNENLNTFAADPESDHKPAVTVSPEPSLPCEYDATTTGATTSLPVLMDEPQNTTTTTREPATASGTSKSTTNKPSMTSPPSNTDTTTTMPPLPIKSQKPIEYTPSPETSSESPTSPNPHTLDFVSQKENSNTCETDPESDNKTSTTVTVTPEPSSQCENYPTTTGATTPLPTQIDNPQLTTATTCEPSMDSKTTTSESTTNKPFITSPPSTKDTATTASPSPIKPQTPATTTPSSDTLSESSTSSPIPSNSQTTSANTPDFVCESDYSSTFSSDPEPNYKSSTVVPISPTSSSPCEYDPTTTGATTPLPHLMDEPQITTTIICDPPTASGTTTSKPITNKPFMSSPYSIDTTTTTSAIPIKPQTQGTTSSAPDTSSGSTTSTLPNTPDFASVCEYPNILATDPESDIKSSTTVTVSPEPSSPIENDATATGTTTPLPPVMDEPNTTTTTHEPAMASEITTSESTTNNPSMTPPSTIIDTTASPIPIKPQTQETTTPAPDTSSGSSTSTLPNTHDFTSVSEYPNILTTDPATISPAPSSPYEYDFTTMAATNPQSPLMDEPQITTATTCEPSTTSGTTASVSTTNKLSITNPPSTIDTATTASPTPIKTEIPGTTTPLPDTSNGFSTSPLISQVTPANTSDIASESKNPSNFSSDPESDYKSSMVVPISPTSFLPWEYDPATTGATTPLPPLIDKSQITTTTTCEPAMANETVTSESTTNKPSMASPPSTTVTTSTTSTFPILIKPLTPVTTTPLPDKSSEFSISSPIPSNAQATTPANTPDFVSESENPNTFAADLELNDKPSTVVTVSPEPSTPCESEPMTMTATTPQTPQMDEPQITTATTCEPSITSETTTFESITTKASITSPPPITTTITSPLPIGLVASTPSPEISNESSTIVTSSPEPFSPCEYDPKATDTTTQCLLIDELQNKAATTLEPYMSTITRSTDPRTETMTTTYDTILNTSTTSTTYIDSTTQTEAETKNSIADACPTEGPVKSPTISTTAAYSTFEPDYMTTEAPIDTRTSTYTYSVSNNTIMTSTTPSLTAFAPASDQTYPQNDATAYPVMYTTSLSTSTEQNFVSTPSPCTENVSVISSYTICPATNQGKQTTSPLPFNDSTPFTAPNAIYPETEPKIYNDNTPVLADIIETEIKDCIAKILNDLKSDDNNSAIMSEMSGSDKKNMDIMSNNEITTSPYSMHTFTVNSGVEPTTEHSKDLDISEAKIDIPATTTMCTKPFSITSTKAENDEDLLSSECIDQFTTPVPIYMSSTTSSSVVPSTMPNTITEIQEADDILSNPYDTFKKALVEALDIVFRKIKKGVN